MVKKFILIDFIDNSSNKLLNKIDELNLKINEVPIFEQRRFLNQISEKYTLSHTTSAKENVLRQKFETLVNCLLNNVSNSNISKKKSSQNPSEDDKNQTHNTQSDAIRLAHRVIDPRKDRKKNDEKLLSSSVFGMEEIDESEDEEKFLSDKDSQDEQEEEQGQKSILKKRNSNIHDSDSGNATLTAKNIISKHSIPRMSFNLFAILRH